MLHELASPTPYPVPVNDQERIAALHALSILDTPFEAGFDRICELARDIFEVPIAIVSFVDRDRQWYKARCGLDTRETPRNIAFCNYAIQDDAPFVVEDATLDPRFRNNPLVIGPPFIRSYAGIPLSLSQGVRLGALCLIDRRPRSFTPEQLALASGLADLVADQMRLHDSNVQLQHQNERQIKSREALRRQSREMRYIANHDDLTGLSNRSRFQQRLNIAIRKSKKHGHKVGLLLLDLDEFKDINDSLGHDAGDALLKHVGRQLASGVKQIDTVARLGGDEFAVVLASMPTAKAVSDVADRLMAKIRLPLLHKGQTIVSTATMGIALCPDHETDGANLLKNADIALYAGKADGRDRCVEYTSTLRTAVEDRVATAAKVRQGIDGYQFIAHYQPKQRMVDGVVTGFEALIRWRHPDQGLLAPAAFSSAFANHDLAAALGRRMLKCVLDDIRAWQSAGLPFGNVAINLSAAEIYHPDLAGWLLARLRDARVDPSCLSIEVTETVFLGRSSDSVRSTLDALKNAGIRIALDDFGTGFASLTHLKQFPVDIIKIDRSFVSDLDSNPESRAIVDGVIGIGRALGKTIVAEGVEHHHQQRILLDCGCDEAQGYLIARPMPASAVPAWLAQQRTMKLHELVQRQFARGRRSPTKAMLADASMKKQTKQPPREAHDDFAPGRDATLQ